MILKITKSVNLTSLYVIIVECYTCSRSIIMMPQGLFFCIYAIIRLAFGDAYPQKQHVSEQNEEWSKTLLSSFFDH